MTIRFLSPSILVIFLYTSIIKMNAQVVKVVDSLKSVSSLSPAKSVKRQDTITLQDFKIDTILSNLNFSNSDSLILDLKDQKKAKYSDSLWLKELYDSTRFEEVFGTPHGLDPAAIAKSMGINAETIDNAQDLTKELTTPIKGLSVVVLDVPNREANADFLKGIYNNVSSM